MDFLERIFHVSPDGGDGFAEFMVILGFIAVGLLAKFRKSSQRSGIGDQDPCRDIRSSDSEISLVV